MHSTLQELRLTQRALRYSCRQCSARCHSPRRAFHHGPPLRNSQEPGSNTGSTPAPTSNDNKDGADRKPAIAPTLTPSNTPYLPHVPPAVGHGPPAPESDQPVAPAFYGSSWNRRQRVKAQQESSEPPTVAPQWFYDQNVTTWGEGQLTVEGRSQVRYLDEYEAEPLSRGGSPSDGSSAGPPKDENSSSTSEAVQSASKDGPEPSETGPQVGEEDSTFDRPRYYVGANQWDEILTTARGLLRGRPKQQHQGEPAALASNLVLHYAGKNGEYLLDEVVHDLASKTGSDLLTLDVQDIADLISQAGSASKDPSAVEGRMLSYDLLTEAPQPADNPPDEKAAELEAVEDDDGFDESGGFDMPGMPGASGPPMLFSKPITIDFSNFFPGPSQSRGRQKPSSLSQLLSSRSSSQQSYGQNFLSSPAVPFRNLVESLLSVLPSKKLGAQHNEERDQLSAEQNLPKQSTIIHVKDVKGIQNILVGSQFLNNLYTLVENRRNNGESIMIVGTEGPKDAAEYPASKIETVQRTPEAGEISRTIVITPMLVDKQASDVLLDDRKRRVATVNLRHLWEMMRVTSKDNFLNLEPGFWNRNICAELTDLDQLRLSKQVWSFHYVHRLASYISGIQDQEAFVELDEREEGKILPLIDAVGRKLTLSDASKFMWADKLAKEDSRRRRVFSPRRKYPSKVEKLKSSVTKHEKRLLSGVIESDKISTTFDDVHVPAETIDALQTLTTLSLVRPEAFTYGVLASDRIPGLLLYGPPGTGKTLLAKAVAKESGATMLEVSAADLNDMYVGEGEKNVKALFSLAKKLSPCVVFLDEADAMFSARSAHGRRVSHRELLNQFLKEWDGMSNDAGSAFLMVATNRPMDFDDAVLRRLPRRLLVDLPTESDRLEILKIHLKAEAVASDVSYADLAKKTPFYSGSDLKNLCVAAALNAVREENAAAKRHRTENPAAIDYVYPEKRTLTNDHFDKALQEITASVSEDMSSLKEIKKFDDVYGDKKGKKRKVPKWGFRGVTEPDGVLDTVKVRE
ncbi:uncharacterized protein HMPREF1541_07400 [Cyphellophora europaea CBS 101466]|uniref:AAA+ ATPase domain-containing protein n=1 Tax=Cyphellophora europaea (strain CBS 101466) TaxID=1220924 RepID=W2RMT2_CYPE1|nr:uncharacterized protein HMPREF1541_07400 [Cyphellophora europaea CBS 101466]ETN37777.1 hypothetical protein HMPREF1541_07400 [Cyphellophora europaea CBS 101466]